ncbi:MAG: type IA DNA topoisomerase [Clostridiales bacterium]|jgi:DNA topoisomerase-3|nr:type IA DNA topoisomerase [Clostridiales bacterium]
MRLLIAEKPSVARDIAAVIGGCKKEKISGCLCWKNDEYVISNALGHLVRLAEPQEYDEKYAKWNLSDLPILPGKFKLLPIADNKAQLSALASLMKLPEVDSLVCATDAGREGELIFRLIYHFAGCKKPFSRLWISSMTDESIRAGLSNLLDGADKDNLFQSGITRAKIDWLIGMNLSRLYSVYYNANYSVGRVQTATVNMIVGRDREIKNFVRKPFFKVFLDNGAEWFDGEIDSFSEKKFAETVKTECENKLIYVISADTKRKTENRPQLFSLTSLQMEANDKHGFSAARTLLAAQSLYEKKLLTYPRTDSSYITEDMPQSVTQVVCGLAFFDEKRVNKLKSQGLNFDKRVVDNSKVTDHHALLPTNIVCSEKLAELTDDETKVIELVINRLFAALDQPYVFDETRYVFECEKHTFKLTSRTSVSLGWREFEPFAEQEKVSYKQGNSFIARNLQIKDCETSPPKKFTESSLLSAMENIDKRLGDKEMRRFVKERGLGTPATRASVIEQIIKRGYVERKSKILASTAKGEQMIDSVLDAVKNAEMTAEMEKLLADIESGAGNPDFALDETIKLVKSCIEREKNITHENRTENAEQCEILGKCPRCGGEVYEGAKNFYCVNFSKKTCIFSVFKDDYFFKSKKKSVTKTVMKALLTDGKAQVKGFYSEAKDKKYDAVVAFKDRTDQNGKPKVGFELQF